MKILVIGSGGREHALAWKLAQSPRVFKVFVAPGNAGTVTEEGVSNVPHASMAALIDFVKTEGVALTVVGPEASLAAGLVDAFQAAGLRIFGPTKQAAQLESSKDYAKSFMIRHRIPPPPTRRSAKRLRRTNTSSGRARRSWSRPMDSPPGKASSSRAPRQKRMRRST